LGWFAKGSKAAEIEAAAFSLKIGEISEPIKTDTGYYIIQVLGHEIHQLTEEELTAQKGKIYSDFVNAAKTAATIKKYDVWASVVPNTPAIPTELRIAQ
jgi:parvulin-like peptidyl-prolyl isomerase